MEFLDRLQNLYNLRQSQPPSAMVPLEINDPVAEAKQAEISNIIEDFSQNYPTAEELNYKPRLTGTYADYKQEERLYNALNTEKLNHPMHIVSNEAASNRNNLINEAIKLNEEINNTLLANDLLIRAENAETAPANPTTRVMNSTKSGLVQGTDAANRQNAKRQSLLGNAMTGVTGGIKTLLGEIDWEESAKATLGNIWDTFTNPAFSAALMQPGISPMQAIVGGIGAARESQAAAASAEREARLKEYEAQTKRIDAQGATPPKLTSEVAKLYDQMEAATKMTETAQNVRITLGDSDSEWSTGGPGKLAKTLRAFGAFFGQDPGEMSADELTRELAKAKTAVLGTKIFGREANKQELEILKELVSEHDWWTSRSQILNAVNALAKEAETRRFNLANRARAFGLPLAHTEMRIPDYPFKRLGSSSGNVLPS